MDSNQVDQKLLNQEYVEQFLRSLSFRVPEKVLKEVVVNLQGYGSRTRYDLWKQGRYRDGTERSPICGKSTVTRIEEMLNTGVLQPYVDYINRIIPGNATGVDDDSSPKKPRKPSRLLRVEAIYGKLRSQRELGIPFDAYRGNGPILQADVRLLSFGPVHIEGMQLELEAVMIDPLVSIPFDTDRMYGTERQAPKVLDGDVNISPLFLIPDYLAKGHRKARVIVQEAGHRVSRTGWFGIDFEQAGPLLGPYLSEVS